MTKKTDKNKEKTQKIITRLICKDRKIKQSERYFYSRATLVICPNHIPYQWKDQIGQYTQNAKVVVITNVYEWQRCTYKDLMNADYVIVSFNFLDKKNTSFTPMNKIKKPELQPELNDKSPKLYNIYWHRIVIDEIHEIIIDMRFTETRRYLNHLESKYKWCLTGTPFRGEKAGTNYSRILNWVFNGNLPEKIYKAEDADNIEPSIYEYIRTEKDKLRMLFRRNTKYSTKKENKNLKTDSLDIQEVWLELSPLERTIYNSRYRRLKTWDNPEEDIYLQQICCHPNVSAENRNILSGISYNNMAEILPALKANSITLYQESLNKDMPLKIDRYYDRKRAYDAGKTWDNPAGTKGDRIRCVTSMCAVKRSIYKTIQLRMALRSYEEHEKEYYGKNMVLCPANSLGQCNSCVYRQQNNPNRKINWVTFPFAIGECGHIYCNTCSIDKVTMNCQMCARLEGNTRELLKIESMKWLDRKAEEMVEFETDSQEEEEEEEKEERIVKSVKIPTFCQKDMIEDFPAYVNVYETKNAN